MAHKRGKKHKSQRARKRKHGEEQTIQNESEQTCEVAEVQDSSSPQNNILRNYTPAINFGSVKVVVECTSGDNIPLSDISTFETTMGKVDTVEQIHDVLEGRFRIRQALLKHHDIDVRTDIKDIFICFTDAAGYRHRQPFMDKYNGDFGIWAGEVEGGDLASHTTCRCGRCSGVHGPVIEVLMKDEQAEMNVLEELD